MVDPATVAAMGLLAGALCAASTLPELILTLKKGRFVSLWVVLRNTTLSLGNSIWVVFGTLAGQLPVQIFCTINAVATGILAARQLHLWFRFSQSQPNQKDILHDNA